MKEGDHSVDSALTGYSWKQAVVVAEAGGRGPEPLVQERLLGQQLEQLEHQAWDPMEMSPHSSP